VARAIHDRSPQRDGPFVSVNLGALPRELATSELFGAVRGAYTGAARDRDGLFRTAHGGTLFLDEVGEASPEVQAMLLRVLETGELYPVGADRPVTVQVRLLAATDADLEDHIRAGRFKAPLLHRLAGYEIQIPALRDRREDIGPLFLHFAREELALLGESHRLSPADPYAEPWLPARLASHLVCYSWPGNLRQLKNVTRRLVIESRGQPQLRIAPRLAAELEVAAPAAQRGAVGSQPSIDLASPPRRKPSDVTEAELLDALRACAWDLKATAERLQIQRPSLYHLIERHPGIRTAGDLGADEIIQCFRACDGDVDAMVARLHVSKRALVRRIRELGLADRDRGST
jgi:two-component system nitrogen regulation response regulator GlnG